MEVDVQNYSMSCSDIISIVDIAITTFVGIWLAIGVQRSLTKNRYLREYFINELNNIREEYRSFFVDIYSGALSAKTIKDRLKIMSLRIGSFDKYIHQEYKINASLLKDAHVDFQQYITGDDEFNNQYNNDTVTFSSNVKTELLRKQGDIFEKITIRAIDINSAHRKWKWPWK